MKSRILQTIIKLILLWSSFYFFNNEIRAQAIELDTFYNDSFCIAAPLPFPNDTINLDSEHVACVEAIKAAALENAHRAWKDSIARLIADHINMQQCMSKPFAETFTVTHQSTEHHYTLYYYNQAGNLVQTIPPAGVHPLGTGSFPGGNWNGDPPRHDTLHISRYEYNSTGLVVKQLSPDAGESTFNYDRAQRLRFAQNAEQQPDNDFAYTKYDGQGRIIEVGELDNHIPTTTELADQSFPDGVSVGVDEPVITTYDFVAAPGTIPSENTRGRIAKAENPYMSSFYDYDAHGNVKEYTQLIPLLHDDTITMKYQYDLISGNVNEFEYEPGELDQLTQRYTYDADNRINSAYSSDDGSIFEEDARYFYYLHGPLARLELGEDKVQGLDYYYSLQGWIKGVNMPGAIDPGEDPGYDGYITGHSNLNGYFGIDTMKYFLGYNDQDYTPIGGSSLLSDPVNQSWSWMSNSILPINGPVGLFNGNIPLMLTDNGLGLLGMAYKYDALHRLRFSENYVWNGALWKDAGLKYKENVVYDANGNINTLFRKGLSTEDFFLYDYYDDVADPVRHPNQLEKLTLTQSAENYQYDEIGNLVHDASESTNLTWDVYGKLRQVSGGPEGYINYQYDIMGNRLNKIRGSEFPSDHYVRDLSGNIIAMYETLASFAGVYTERLKEFDLYGSRRLASNNPNKLIYQSPCSPIPCNLDTLRWASNRNLTTYELSNHLGNVLTTISDQKLGQDEDADDIANRYFAKPVTIADYYPFGLEMPGRTMSVVDQKYGFNGKERDYSINSPVVYDYGFRIYNPAIGRFLSVDPLTRSYPMLTPYQFASNTPLQAIDLDGLEDFHYLLLNNDGNNEIQLISDKPIYDFRWSWKHFPLEIYQTDRQRYTLHTGVYHNGSTPDGANLYQFEINFEFSSMRDLDEFITLSSDEIDKKIQSRLNVYFWGDLLSKGFYNVGEEYKDSRPGTSTNIRNNYDNLKFGKNSKGHLIKHSDVIGYGNISVQKAQKIVPELEEATSNLFTKMSLDRIGKFERYENARYYTGEGKMIITQNDGTFITMLPKTSNGYYQKANKIN